MKFVRRLTALFFACAVGAQAQNLGICADPVSSIVDRFWKSATEGQLLSAEGWHRANGYFLNPEPWPGNKRIWVISNVWGPASLRETRGGEAEVEMRYEDVGSIDAKLRYTPPKQQYFGRIPVIKTSMVYHLKLAPSHWNMYKSDGKTIDKVMTCPTVWQIENPQGSAWTTVNTAIRYVFEVRAKTNNPAIRRNADQTISELLKWQ